MGLKDLPCNFSDWQISRNEHLNHDLIKSKYTLDLFRQYKKHLGIVRYSILKNAQMLVVPFEVKKQLNFRSYIFRLPLIHLYKLSRRIKLDGFIKYILFPKVYKEDMKNLYKIP